MAAQTGAIVNAYLDETGNGIYIRIIINGGKQVVVHSTTEDQWLRLKEGMNAKEELQKVCDLLVGYRTVNGKKEEINGVYPKMVNLTDEGEISF